MDFEKFENKIKRINSRIEEVLNGSPEILYDAAIHLSMAGGKRLRPILCLLSCESVNGKWENALDTAVAVELIHTFTLIHDDIMDNDELRRGIPSVHVKFGNSTAILAGDLLFSKAFELSHPKAVNVLANASVGICEGQELDILLKEVGIDSLSEDKYIEMVTKKTAKLFEAATKSGAIIGNGSKEEIENLSKFGLNLGIAFQIRDDILDLTADEETLGKPVGSDIIEGKRTLIVINAIESLGNGERRELIEILEKDNNSREEIEYAISLLKKSGAIDYSYKKAREFVDAAIESLSRIPESEARNDLMSITDFAVDRET
ncbi:MAG: polyprenyl synthetase family protein [Candidatus Altiarchaeales archaeon]|nr:MAG: polyprenyl synthetase family protein [Candidatus Altiarchaeales archaeon]RLI95554.1 MAG: polyprenyl synthetase family protein [Candidatus Altiarchaeales archaeon]RLI95593.1 MAG: polyprenyl synthetase family protein [Candidatus Altiarchaeales archaeon]HDO82541.1 polyprenyl synthetase family protein [Candidatus Altiarchaeales archaeon]HEX55190.1 polyprenyl synthetase family protein [Candidatus Altiarchaeales archaeon]